MAIANVQRKAKGANAASVSIGSGDGWATPTTGNLLVVTANSDATVSITGTWTAGPSVVDGNGTYIWYRISDGTETTITCTPSVSDTICITAAEYSGNAASPFDVSNSSTIASSSGTTTTSVSVTTTADGDLIIAAACLHSYGNPAPTSPSWTNSFVNQLTATTGGTTSADCTTFYAELIAGAAGSYSTSASWTNIASDRQELVIAFKAAATAGVGQTSTARHPGRGPSTARFLQTLQSSDQLLQNIALTDTGAETDTLSVTATVALSDTAAAADQLTVAAAVPLSDTGAGADTLAVTVTTTITDTGAAVDQLTVADITVGARQPSPWHPGAGPTVARFFQTPRSTDVNPPTSVSLSDTAAGADALSVSVTLPLADTAAGSDSVTIAATVGVTDTSSGVDAVSVLAALALAEAAAALDALAVAATVPLAEAGAGTDGISVSVGGVTPKTLADIAAAVDALCVCATQLRPDTGTVTRPDTGTVTRPDTGVVTRCC